MQVKWRCAVYPAYKCCKAPALRGAESFLSKSKWITAQNVLFHKRPLGHTVTVLTIAGKNASLIEEFALYNISKG
ncbi:hypothetical protein BKP57_05925 [Virgibacillus sp. 6R]|uniref:Uncharacterized protein n=1 Tax=Virgibacillus pantothenticus TaxID=1473 RepID=A0A0L0QKS0_VIRPA|nr:hypothetical protein BKP57_05925 [Virgibacillus sp. 6R]KNE19182.1 hypothetical protein AFK71_11610 [Virgibacillus pantothenticus]SIS99073.1 hypothetical protein SAMN05421787_10939 [Virgibacillus pantothenticus]